MNSLARRFQIEALDDDEFRARLVSIINNLILNDFNRLVQILYQVDVNESNLRNLLQRKTSTDAGEILADLLIEREKKKDSGREQRSSDHDLPEDEKW